MPRAKLFGVDGNWYLHRIFHTQKFESKDPATTIARRFVAMICKDALAVRATNMVVSFDGARVFRYDLDPEYKANRSESSSDKGVYDHLGGLIEYLAMCGIQCIQLNKYEADDVLGTIATIYDGEVTIGCRDKDAYQYLRRPNQALYDSSHKVFKGKVPISKPKTTVATDVEAIFGVPPKLCIDLQTLTGDKVDNVPQLVTRVKAIEGLKEHGSLKAWLANDRDLRKLLKPKRERLLLNRKLVKLKLDIGLTIKAVKWSSDPKMVTDYIMWKQFCNPRSKGLF